jgi:hypothetical protein
MDDKGTPSPTERAAELAQFIAKRYDDEELTKAVLELIDIIADPFGDQNRWSAAHAAMRMAYMHTPAFEDGLLRYVRGDKKEEAVEKPEDQIDDQSEKGQM